MSRELTSAEIKKLMKPKPQEKKPRKKSGQDYATRTYENWFRLSHTFQMCMVPSHDPELNKRPSGATGELGRMCAAVGDKFVCRYCFLEEKDTSAWGQGYWL